MVRGDITVVGPSMDTIQADLIGKPLDQLASKEQTDANVVASMAAREARSLLGVSITDAGLLAEAFDGNDDSRLFESQSKCSLASLCSFHRKYSGSEVWDHLCDLWDSALQCLALQKVIHALCIQLRTVVMAVKSVRRNG